MLHSRLCSWLLLPCAASAYQHPSKFRISSLAIAELTAQTDSAASATPATPARYSSSGTGSFKRRVIQQRVQREICPRCSGSKVLTCHACRGAARLGRGGFHARNPVTAARIMGSKWTAMERTLGWRHFQVTDKRKAGREVFVCMVSTCDGSKKLWTNAGILKSRQAWAPGWLRKEELAAMASEDSLVECKACAGAGHFPCMLCSSGGAVVQL